MFPKEVLDNVQAFAKEMNADPKECQVVTRVKQDDPLTIEYWVLHHPTKSWSRTYTYSLHQFASG